MKDLLPSPSRVFVAGHRGLVGAAVTRRLVADGHLVLTKTRSELDLRDIAATASFLRDTQPDCVVLAAARVGGIMANCTHPVEFLEDNLRIQVSVISGAHSAGVRRLLFLGSSCIYPRLAPQPIKEESLLTGPLESTNEGYALAKIAGLAQVQAYRRQHGASYISAMPTNLYGPDDNFDLQSAHVLPALIRRFHEAKASMSEGVVVWGSGSPRREFLHVDDLADACLTLLRRYDGDSPINVGVGQDVTIRKLAQIVQKVVGYSGRIIFDGTKPDGTPRKLLNISRITALGWRPSITLPEGIAATYEAFLTAQQ
ncbi:GDP-L-fucose synthase family protein [Streptomyces sp. NPDC048362]|uniref:GDP-L-fucose synthase family protein n=1 Tax=Streptomyces sp. NPDC048362 TaxID=3365539 RepID=UPI0037243D6C